MKGHERLTIMIIPHNQKEALSLQLSWTIILFLTGSLVLAVIFSGYGLYWKTVQKGEMEHLRKRYGINLSDTIQVQKNIRENFELQEDLTENLRSIAEVVGMKKDALNSLPNSDFIEKKANSTLEAEVLERIDMGPTTDYLKPIYSMKTFFYTLEIKTPLLNALKTSLHDGIGTYMGLPMGRPVNKDDYFFDSSLFGKRINPISGYGFEMHPGVDMSAPRGTPVFSAGNGEVYSVRSSENGYGNSIILKHENGFFTLFAHLSKIIVRTGEKVARGQKIGEIGNTGRTTGAHLHYEIRINNSEKIDPLPFICSTDMSTQTCIKFNQKNNP